MNVNNIKIEDNEFENTSMINLIFAGFMSNLVMLERKINDQEIHYLGNFKMYKMYTTGYSNWRKDYYQGKQQRFKLY